MDRPTILARLLRHRLSLILGVVVAAYAAATPFASIGLFPPSVKAKPLAHSTASTEFAVGSNSAVGQAAAPDLYVSGFSPKAVTLADMVASPEVLGYVARSAGIPPARIAVDSPLWTNISRDQEWDTGEKRASQIVAERRPYRITLNDDPGFQAPVVDVITQGPTTNAAVRLAQAVVSGLGDYLSHLQATGSTPVADRYRVTEIVPVTVARASTALLANVAVFVFLAVFALWSGLILAASSLVRDLRIARTGSEVSDPADRSSRRGAGFSQPSGAPTATG